MRKSKTSLVILALSGAVFSLFAVAGRGNASGGPEGALAGNPVASKLAGKSCDLHEDAEGVPHVRAGDPLELFACFGFLHGRDRAWQMDFFRRTFQGRKAEVLGRDAIRGDFVMRLLGLEERARRIFEKLGPAERDRLWAYAYGVNRGMAAAEARGVYEFRSLGYRPEPWEPAHSVGMLLLQSFDQTRKSFEQDIQENDQRRAFGEEAPGLFNPEGTPWDVSVLKPGEYAAARPGVTGGKAGRVLPAGLETAQRTGPLETPLASELRALRGYFPDEDGKGSNNWVVAPERSASGHAWLANDPHLGLKHPPFWYWANITGAGYDVIGASLPGLPVIVSGANRHAAWGLTNAYLDVADVYSVPEGDLAAAVTERPWIWVRVWKFSLPFFFKTFRRTNEGWPVLPIESARGRAVVLRWTGFDLEPRDLAGLDELLTGDSAAAVDRALSHVGVPSWNFVFADDHGAIGYRAVGRVPKREKAPAFGIPEGRLAEVGRFTLLTAAEMPHALNPARGFVATANNRQWPGDSALSGGRAYSKGFRAFRIEELLTREKKHDRESLRRIQCDVQAVDARFLLPELLDAAARDKSGGARPLTPREEAVFAVLKGWDYEAGLDCRACAVYRRWLQRLFSERGLDEVALYHELHGPGAAELRGPVVAAFSGALDDLRVDARGTLRAWGELHRNSFSHLSGDGLFVADSIPTPGDVQSVNPGTVEWRDGVFAHIQGASQRLIVELTSPPTVHAVLAGSNVDVEGRNLSDPAGPWMKWARCDQEHKVFPVDWTQVKVTALPL